MDETRKEVIYMLDIKDWTVYYTVNGKRRRFITVKTVTAADAALVLCAAQYAGTGEIGIKAGKSLYN